MTRKTASTKSTKSDPTLGIFAALGEFLGAHKRTRFGRFNLAGDVLVFILLAAGPGIGEAFEFITSLKAGVQYDLGMDGCINIAVLAGLIAFCMYLTYKTEKYIQMNKNKLKK